MSLTSLLNNWDVKKRFLEEFPKPVFTIKKELLAPPFSENYALVGTAFDYLLRFYIKYINPNAITKRWIAEDSLEILKEIYEVNENAKFEFALVRSLISMAKKKYNTFLQTGHINNELLRFTLFLGEFDSIYRSGYIPETYGNFDREDIEDLNNLISLVNPQVFKVKKICILNPTFGQASNLVGGADADLIIDDMIIEIKTTKYFQLKREYFNQLIGYYTLYRIDGIDGMPPQNKIKKLGIYYSRHGYLHSYNVKDIIDRRKFPNFIEWFKERAVRGNT